MGKKLSLLLSTAILAFSLGLSACSNQSGDTGGSGGSASSNSGSANGAWELLTETDDFGDEIDGGHTYLFQPATGEFSNTATVSSDCTVGFGILWNRPQMRYNTQIVVLEYGDNPITYSDYDSMTLKTKCSDGAIHEYKLTGSAPSGALTCNAAGLIFDLLEEPDSMRCILEVGNSRYEFSLSSAGFGNAFAENRQDVQGMIDEDNQNNPFASDSLSAALRNIMVENNDELTRAMAAEYLIAHAFDYERLSAEELESVLNGTFGTIQLNDGQAGYSIMSWKQLQLYDVVVYDITPTGWSATSGVVADGKGGQTIDSVSNDAQFEITADGTVRFDNGYVMEFRKIADGYYLCREVDVPTNLNSEAAIYSLYYLCNEEARPTEHVS